MNLFEQIKKVVTTDLTRRAQGQDCPDCVDAFTRKPVAGKWQLGVTTKPIRCHWLADGSVRMQSFGTGHPIKDSPVTSFAICGAEVISK